MAVTVTTNTLSTRVRYLNVSASTANTDAKDIVLAMANALIALGWSRYDTAGETAVVGSDDNAGVILRRECYDFAQSGHYNYLGLRLVGSGTNTYTFYLIQAADWSSTTSMSAFVSAATATVYTPNTTANTRFLNFEQGGTIWLFDSGKTLLITSQSGTVLSKDIGSTWVVGEYKKEFGENVNEATGYIHNGVFTNDRWLLDGCGIGYNIGVTQTGFIAVGGAWVNAGVAPYYHHPTTLKLGLTSAVVPFIRTGMGAGYSQYVLTEAPSVGTSPSNAVTSTRSAAAPATCGLGFTTRLLMGFLGYIGHINSTHYTSINAEFLNNINGTETTEYKYPEAVISISGSAVSTRSCNLFSSQSTVYYSLLNSIQEYSPTTLPNNLKFAVFEPTLSCGTTNGIPSSSGSITYTGPQYKFSMLGRIFNMKIFGPYTDEKYVFLDSMTIPCDADGFYQEGGTNKDFWLIPNGNNIAFVMPK